MSPEEPGKVIDDGAMYIVQYFLKEIGEGKSYLVRHSTDLKRIFGGVLDQPKAKQFYQVRMAELIKVDEY